MRSARKSIIDGCFPQFTVDFMKENFPDGKYPGWVVDALGSVSIDLKA
jgi:hypothetical protein